MSIKRYKLLLDQTAEGTTDWVALDTRYDEDPTRSLQIAVTTGDSIRIDVTTKDVKGIDKSFLDTMTASDYTTYDTVTATDTLLVEGPWTYIRVAKTGTNGPAKVLGFI